MFTGDPDDRDGWLVKTGDEVIERYHTDDLRFLVHWSAEVFMDFDELKKNMDGSDNLTHEQAIDTLIKDVRSRGIHIETPSDPLNDPAFIGAGSLPVDQLRPVIRISYERFTLVDLLNAERVTIDRHIVFQRGNETRTLDGLVIAEVKQRRKHPSFFRRKMRSMNIREGSVSKYCMGTLLLNDQVKRNRFKIKLNRILKITDSLQQTI